MTHIVLLRFSVPLGRFWSEMNGSWSSVKAHGAIHNFHLGPQSRSLDEAQGQAPLTCVTTMCSSERCGAWFSSYVSFFRFVILIYNCSQNKGRWKLTDEAGWDKRKGFIRERQGGEKKESRIGRRMEERRRWRSRRRTNPGESPSPTTALRTLIQPVNGFSSEDALGEHRVGPCALGEPTLRSSSVLPSRSSYRKALGQFYYFLLSQVCVFIKRQKLGGGDEKEKDQPPFSSHYVLWKCCPWILGEDPWSYPPLKRTGWKPRAVKCFLSAT